MRRILFIVNCALGMILVGGIVANLSAGRGSRTFSVKKTDPSRAAKPIPKKTEAPVKAAPTTEEQLQTILALNIFNSERCASAAVRGRGGRIELSLVGTFKVGELSGAIIRQKGGQTGAAQNFTPFAMGMGGLRPPDMRGGMNDSAAAGVRGGRGFRGAGGNRGVNRFPGGAGTADANADSAAAAGVRQYVRLGETMTNGYTLTEVTRTRAVLTRSGSKLELEIEDPSKNQVKSVARTRQNAGQQFIQNQLRSQQQMMQVMQQMQRGMMMNNSIMGNMSRNLMQNQGSGGRGTSRR